MVNIRFFLVLGCCLAINTCFGQCDLELIPYLDTSKNKHVLFDVKENKFRDDEFDYILPRNLNGKCFIHMYNRENNKNLIIYDSGREYRIDSFKIEQLFSNQRVSLGAVVSKDYKEYGVLSVETCEWIFPVRECYNYSLLEDRYLFIIDSINQVIIYYDIIKKDSSKITFSGEPIRVHKRYMFDSLYYYTCKGWYTSRGGYQGLIDVANSELLYYGMVNYFYRINQEEVLIKKSRGRLVLLNIKTKKEKKSKFREIYPVLKDTKYHMILKKKGKWQLTDSSLKRVGPIKYFKNLFYNGKDFFYHLSGGWYKYNPASGRLSDRVYNNVLMTLANEFFGETDSALTDLTIGESYGLSYPGKYEWSTREYIVTELDSLYVVYLRKTAQVVKQSKNMLFPMKNNSEYFVYKTDDEKYGLEDLRGKKLTPSIYSSIDVLISFGNYIGVDKRSFDKYWRYLIDMNGNEYLK